MPHSRQYDEVLASDRWREARYLAGRRAGWKCEKCGNDGKLDGHHWMGYSMLGREMPSDIRMLCQQCHRQAHEQPDNWLLWVFGICIVAEVVWWVARQVLQAFGIGNG